MVPVEEGENSEVVPLQKAPSEVAEVAHGTQVARNKRYRAKNPEKYREYMRRYMRKYRAR